MDRPRVITCNQASLDGRLTLAPDVLLLEGDGRWSRIVGESDLYGWIRAVHDPDVLLEGSGSFVAADAGPVRHPPHRGDPSALYEHFLPAEVVEQDGRRWMSVVDGRGRNVRTVAATGGGRLGGALLRTGLVDEVDVEFLPAVIGGRGTPTLFDAPPLSPDEVPTRLELIGHEVTEEGHVRLRYRVLVHSVDQATSADAHQGDRRAP